MLLNTKFAKMLLLPILLLSTFMCTLYADPCADGNHNIINDDHRSELYQPDALSLPICDYLGDITDGVCQSFFFYIFNLIIIVTP